MAYYSSFSTSSFNTGGNYSGNRSQGSLLQVVIRKLVDSIDDEERKQHYEEIKNDLNIAEDNMDSLVSDHQSKLQSTLDTFGKIDATIKESQMKVRMLRENLQISKSQLHCKREALKRLWFDEVKYKKMLKLVDQVDHMKHVPEKLQEFRAEKKYYEATELLNNSVSILEGELSKIDALRELRSEMKQLKDSFHDELINELQYQLYAKATGSTYKLSPSGLPTRFHSRSFFDRSSPLPTKKSKVGKHGCASPLSGRLEQAPVQTPPLLIEGEIQHDQAPKDTDNIAASYLGSLVEALSMLGKVPDMLDAVQRRMIQELVLIVEKTSIRITQLAKEKGVSPSMEPSAKCTNSKYLQTLLDMCFLQFEDVVAAHSVLLNHLQKTKMTYKGNYELYEEADVWTAIQQVLREMLEIYLSVDEEKPQTTMSAFAPFTIAGHEFMFIRRRVPAKARKQPLFRFDNSRHALSVSSYMKEQRDKELASQVQSGKVSAKIEHHFEENQPSISQHMVCRPSTRNITVMYSPVREFILKIEDALQLQANTHCDLYIFLQDFVEQRFIDAIHLEYQEKLDNALKPEAREAITLDSKVLRGTSKPALLTSCLTLYQTMEELRSLMIDMPMYSASFLTTMAELLQTYIDTTQTMFKEITSVSSGPSVTGNEKLASQKVSVVSARWARDEGIARLVTNFPSWQSLHKKKNKDESPGLGKDSIHTKESENLLSSLGSEIKHRSDILQDHDSFKLLSVLHESTEWLAGKLKEMTEIMSNEWTGEDTDGGALSSRILSRRHSEQEQEAAHDNEQHTVELISQMFKSVYQLKLLSQSIVIVLHLELRSHCFYHLLPTLKQSNYVCEHEVSDADAGVKDLGVDLKALKMVTAGVLTGEKQIYLFDGLGHLIAAIFISSTAYLKKININGVKKMCRNIQHIQSCLSKITSIREKDLDLAQKYFAMLYVNEEEFLKLVMEQGKVFTELDYANALSLLSRSQAQTNPVRLDNNIKKLEQMFADDAC